MLAIVAVPCPATKVKKDIIYLQLRFEMLSNLGGFIKSPINLHRLFDHIFIDTPGKGSPQLDVASAKETCSLRTRLEFFFPCHPESKVAGAFPVGRC